MGGDRLSEVRAIEELKYRYFRGLDLKDWDLFASTLAEDATAAYSGGALTLTGRDAIVKYMRDNLGTENRITSHKVHHPEITVNDDGTASGVWGLEDVVLDLDAGIRIEGVAYYDDRYVLRDGSWLIQATGYRRVYEVLEPRAEGSVLTASWWATDGRSNLAPQPD